MSARVSLTFLGAAGTVTGSRYLLTADGGQILVDCGLFQGLKGLRERNWAPMPLEPASLDAVVLTHAHIDHSGYLPRLHRMGFRGKVYCTPGTRDLLHVLLPDAGHLQEEEARYANRHGFSKHHPAMPLYTRQDAELSLRLLEPRDYDQPVLVAPGFVARFTRAGHILGSACVSISAGGVGVTFTGDVGRPNDPIMRAPAPLPGTDYLITESTYGDRCHSTASVEDALLKAVVETVERGGVLLVPSFAVGRTQHLLHLLGQLMASKRIPQVPVYLDSPMAINATGIFCEHTLEHRLDGLQCQLMSDVATFARTPDESKGIDQRPGPMIVISASGMATGGRVLHHLKRFLPDEKNTVLFVGYQAAGTRGRSLEDGADEIKIHGEYVPVRARIARLDGLSAHADYLELLDWLRASAIAPRRVFVTHGEPAAADALRRRIKDTLGWEAVVPNDGSTWHLEAAGSGSP